ncbi:MAG: ROK family protein [Halodesulfurarchaeum sp.]
MTGADQHADPVLGIDLDATTIRVGVSRGSEIGTRLERPTPDGPTGDAVTEAILDAVGDVTTEADLDPGDISGIGVGSIGPIDHEAGVVIGPGKLPRSIEGIRLAGPLGNEYGGPVSVDTRGRAALVGERAAASDPPADMAFLALASDLDAGVAVDGTVLQGWGSNAGSVSHFQVVEDGGMMCGCGREGHWAAYAAGANIPAYARSLTDEFPGSSDLPLDEGTVSAHDIFERAGEDVLADVTIHRLGRWNAAGLADLVHAFGPSLVSIGGELALEYPDLVVDPIRERLPDRVSTRVPEIRETPMGADAVLEGAMALGRAVAGD